MTASLVAAQGAAAPSVAVPQVATAQPPVAAVVLTDGEGALLGVSRQAAVALYTEVASARTATGNTTGTAFPLGVQQVFVTVNVTAVSGTTPTLTVAFQQQDANGTFVTVGVTASITATGISIFSVGPGTANGHMLVAGGGQWRLLWTIGGTTPSFTMQLGVTGR